MTPLALPRSRRRPAIIAALCLLAAVAVAGCSFVKMGYGQAAPLAFRWLDGYVEFNDAQSLRVRGALDEWLAWHRRTQLPDYAELLARAQVEVAGEVSPDRMCGWVKEVRTRAETALERTLPVVVDVALTLSPAQIANIDKRYVERNETWRDDFMQREPAKRKRAAVKREVERAETLYGRLDDAQRELVNRSVAESPFDAELSYAERLRRQQDALETMRRLGAGNAGRDEAEAQLRAYVQRLDRSPRPDYRRYSERLIDYNCAFASALHNSTSIEQRRHAAKKLKGYEADFRDLAADATT